MATENKVFINEYGIVEIHVVGSQTKESVSAMGSKTQALLESREAKPLILDDITRMAKTDTPARQEVSNLAKTLRFKKTALVGNGSIAMRVGTNLMLSAIGMGAKLRYFESRDKAIAWLLGS
ncbi:MAG TPA: STAS/SEC14 domain-containing protein [Candidatus Saccharimonadales bacterium]|nr:STAS/SEC14 domain-containing protein [Candidatus Saccharimonadales bacterium]